MPAQKDYSTAFSALSSQYGWGPVTSAPVPVQTAPTKKPKQKKQEKESRGRAAEPEDASAREGASHATRDAEGAFGALASKIGFGGGWATPVHSMSRKH